MCLNKPHLLLMPLGQILHSNRFLTTWSDRCLNKFPFNAKFLPNRLHLNFISPEWTTICFDKLPLSTISLLHSSHLNFFHQWRLPCALPKKYFELNICHIVTLREVIISAAKIAYLFFPSVIFFKEFLVPFWLIPNYLETDPRST